MTQGERIKLLRKERLNLTLDKFGQRLGVGKSAISDIERGRNNLSDQMLVSICREFNVSESWLRTGEGEMFIPMDIDEEIAHLIASLRNEEDDSFKKRLLAVLANLSEEQWDFLADFAESIAKK